MLNRFVLGGAVLAAVLIAVSLAAGLGRGATASVQLDPEEQAFVVLLNDYRAQNGLGPLSIDSSIQSAAEWMSADMGENDYFSHTDSGGGLPWDRMCNFGYCYSTSKGENIAAGYVTAQAVFEAWRISPGHNSNMLSENYVVMGVALVHTPGSAYGYYWTNDFGGYQAEPLPPPPAPSATATPTTSPTATPAADADSDGVPDGADNCPNWHNPTQALPSWPIPADDPDCDGFDTTTEAFLGTDPLGQCAADNTSDNEPTQDKWPVDHTDDQIANLLDVVPFIPALNSVAPNPPYSARLDLDMSGDIDLFDVVPFIQLLNKACSP